MMAAIFLNVAPEIRILIEGGYKIIVISGFIGIFSQTIGFYVLNLTDNLNFTSCLWVVSGSYIIQSIYLMRKAIGMNKLIGV
jgi:hypothetical protein